VGIIPKSDSIANILVKKHSEILSNSNGLQLIGMRKQIKNLSCSMYDVSDHDDVFSIRDLNDLINATFDRKQLCLNEINVYNMMDGFGNISTLVNVQY